MADVTVLFSLAHPDDESFGGAGTAMKAKAAGARTVLVTATLGERGKTGDPPLCGPEDIAEYRERELREAAAIIGFDELHLLGYRDKELTDAPHDVIRRTLVTIIRRERPAIVLTFDPNGYNQHADHVAISRFTNDAVAAAGDPRWYPDAGEPHHVSRLLWTPPIMPWDPAWPSTRAAHPGVDFLVDVSNWRERRADALRAHRTQHLSVERIFGHPERDRILGEEGWRQAWGPRLRGRPAGDILEDVM